MRTDGERVKPILLLPDLFDVGIDGDTTIDFMHDDNFESLPRGIAFDSDLTELIFMPEDEIYAA